MKVAVLGLGIIGSRAATRLRDNHEVGAWNRSAGRIDGQAPSLRSAIDGASVAQLFLRDAAAVREVSAAIAELDPGPLALWNHATVDLATTRWLAGFCRDHGWDFLDAPFTGSRDAAAAGQLVYYVGGADASVAQAEPLLLETGRTVLRCGEVGDATVIKLVTNQISACTVQALGEALATARSQGISAETLRNAVRNNACGSPLAEMKLGSLAAGDFTPHFSLKNMLKDSRYALELAGDAERPALRCVSERMTRLVEAGRGEDDFSVLAEPES